MPIRSGNPDRTKSPNRSFLSYFDTIFNGLGFRKDHIHAQSIVLIEDFHRTQRDVTWSVSWGNRKISSSGAQGENKYGNHILVIIGRADAIPDSQRFSKPYVLYMFQSVMIGGHKMRTLMSEAKEWVSRLRERVRTSEAEAIVDDEASLISLLVCDLKRAEKRTMSAIVAHEINNARARGKPHGRPRSMTPERIAVAIAMARVGQSGQIIWKTLAAMPGPQIGRSAYYLWLKGHRTNPQHL
ncbi:hypothetical protein [Paenirhodobacter populi]|uniref:hypothetical protein n=1 Tax=Paenirhodobacter populi TaxID=2306993 RepID=UPI000FE2FB74|nr:hypothetical protein [Sinirhodobacter populi]RWR04357.1 hypothetical protein D2T32_19745 [Sinirhodobacter populi]